MQRFGKKGIRKSDFAFSRRDSRLAFHNPRFPLPGNANKRWFVSYRVLSLRSSEACDLREEAFFSVLCVIVFQIGMR